MSAHRLTLTTLVSLCVAAGALICSSIPARAAVVHDFLPAPSEEISKGVPAGAKAAGGEEALTGPVGGEQYYGMTVAPGGTPGETGHLWVTESGRVDEFSASTGKWESQLQHFEGGHSGVYRVAVGGSTGEREVYVAAGPELAVFGPAGTLQAEWTGSDTPEGSFGNSGDRQPSEPAHVSGIAVDDSASLADWAKGDVFVSTEGGGTGFVVDVFAPEKEGREKYVTQLQGTCPVAGATVGAATCEAPQVIPFAGPEAVAVDATTGDLLVADGAGMDVFEPVGLDEYRYLNRITGIPGRPFKTTIDNVTSEDDGDIYISEEGETSGALPVVYQFNAEGVYRGSLTGTTPTAPFVKVVASAVDPESGEVYIGDKYGEGPSEGVVDVFGPSLVVPDTVTGAAADVSPSSAILNGRVNPLGEGAATCAFEWGTTSELGQSVRCSAGVPEGDTPVDVHSEALTGLLPDTTYYYRLQATGKNGTNTGEGTAAECEGRPAAVACFTTAGPGIEASVSDVASTSATFDAEIDPNNSPTSYYFQYGSENCATAVHECATAPAPPGAALGSAKGGTTVAQHVQGLAAGTTYHYRVVTVSELSLEVAPGKFETKVEAFDGPDQTFTTQGIGTEFQLPDGRAWEMVSPPEKEGALIESVDAGDDFDAGEAVQAAADGSAVSYTASAPTEAEPQGDTGTNEQDFSWRAPNGGWSTEDIIPPNEQSTGLPVGDGNNYRVFSSDLSLAVVQPFGKFTPLSPEASEQTAYLRTNFTGGDVDAPCVSGCYRPLATNKPGYANVPTGASFGCGAGYQLVCGPYFVGGTPDLSHVVFGSGGLTETQWIPREGGGQDELYEWSAGAPASRQLQPLYLLPADEGGYGVLVFPGGAPSPLARQLSDDGSVFFDYGAGTPSGSHLYLHDVASGESARLDVAQGVAEPSEGAAKFLYASSDGSRVLFSDPERLTKAAGGGIYECRIVESGGRLGCSELELTGLSGGALVGGSEDASYLYLVGAGNRLYADHYDGAGWTQTLVATLANTDSYDWEDLVQRTSEASPNGLWLAFMSSEDLTGYSTLDAVSGQHDYELYLYDADANRLVCASCNPTGALPVGTDEGEAAYDITGERWLSASVPGWTQYTGAREAVYQPRFVDDSGRLFFNSAEALVPQDDNGTWDVYEYEPPGVGDCTTSSATFDERPDGCVNMISSGTSAEDSTFLDASEDGSDIFFVTAAQLAPQDRDSASDVYDAHECTERSPCPAVVTTPPACTSGDACKPAPTPQPTLYGAPSSETFSGAGNITPAVNTRVVKPRVATRSQKLARALRGCRRARRRKRSSCERRARRTYGSAQAKRSSRKGGGR